MSNFSLLPVPVCFLFFSLYTFLSNASTRSTVSWEEKFDNNIFLDPNYRLYWSLTSNNLWIEFGLQVNSTGWIGIGISPNGEMHQSDIIMAWIMDNGEDYYINDINKTASVILQNRHTVHNETAEAEETDPQPSDETPILMDDQSNVILIDAARIDSTLYFHFYRLLLPTSEHTRNITSGLVHVIYAWNNDLPVAGEDPIYHGSSNRGTEQINLIESDSGSESGKSEWVVYFLITIVIVVLFVGAAVFYVIYKRSRRVKEVGLLSDDGGADFYVAVDGENDDHTL